MSNIADKLQENKLKLNNGIKKYIFDLVSIVIVIALLATSLDLFGLIDFRKIKFIEFIISWFPYFAAAMLLNTNFYKKGVFVGKNTVTFNNVITVYSSIANSLSGEQIKGLYPFCDKYNDDAKQSIQEQILRKEGLTIADFNNEFIINDEAIPPLKTLSRKKLKLLGYTRAQIRAIKNAKKVHVKGICVNVLLSSIDVKDSTNIGSNERELETKKISSMTVRYIVSTVLLSVITIKDTISFGLLGLVLVLFKVMYVFANSCMSYFKGYDDATINLASYFTRKTDILKMYLDYVPEDNDIYE